MTLDGPSIVCMCSTNRDHNEDEMDLDSTEEINNTGEPE